MTRLFVWIVLLLGLIAQVSADPLEVLKLPTDGTPVRSTQALEDYRSYYAVVRSPYDLRKLRRFSKGYLIAFNGKQVDGQEIKLVSEWNRHSPMHELRFRLTGVGEPLTVQLAEDLSQAVPKATLDIEPVPPPPPRPTFSWGWFFVLLGLLAVLAAAIFLYWVLGQAVNAAANRQRALQHQHEQEEEQQRRAEQAKAEAARALARRQEAAERERRAHEAAEQEALRHRARCLLQWAELERYYLDPAFQKDFVTTHLRTILDTWGQEWFQASQDVKNDEPLRVLLEQEYPLVLEVLDARLEVYRLARRQEVTPSPEPKPKPTTEGVRDSKVKHIDVKALDLMAERLRHYEAAQAYAEELRSRGFSEEAIEIEVQRFRDELTTQVEEEKEKRNAGRKPSDYTKV